VGSLTQTVFLSRMRESLAFLSARERLVLNLRYGLKDKKVKTQQEVAEAMGIDRSRVSRIEKRAIERMRETMDLPPEPTPSL
jgi:RNA polymerase sporulation-specific sigma factor